MKQAGQIALLPFPFTDLSESKLRPVLLLRPASFVGHIGRIDAGRLDRLLHRLAAWLTEEPPP